MNPQIAQVPQILPPSPPHEIRAICVICGSKRSLHAKE